MTELAYGEHGLEALEAGELAWRHVEAAQVVLAEGLAGHGRLFVRVAPVQAPGSSGHPERAHVARGAILFEIDGPEPEVARRLLEHAQKLLPVKTRLVRA